MTNNRSANGLPSNNVILALAEETRGDFYEGVKQSVDTLFKSDPAFFEMSAKKRGYTLGVEFQKQIDDQKKLLSSK